MKHYFVLTRNPNTDRETKYYGRLLESIEEASQLMGTFNFLLTRNDADDFMCLVGIDECTVYRFRVDDIVSIELSKGDE